VCGFAIACLLMILVKSEVLGNDLITITVSQVGNNVVATSSGAVDLTDLNYGFTSTPTSYIDPDNLELVAAPGGEADYYGAGLSGPQTWGSDMVTYANSETGDDFGVGEDQVIVPSGYVSGGLISSSATFDNATFASLGLTPGIYTYTYGSDADAGEILVDAPEPSAWALMIGSVALLGFRARRRLAWT
jgi:hypothetical protein